MGPVTTYTSKLFKADKRVGTLLSGGHVSTTKFEHLLRVDDIYIEAGNAIPLAKKSLKGQSFILPIAGGAILLSRENEETPLLPGSLYTLSDDKIEGASLINPFQDQAVNLILIQTILPAETEGVTQCSLPLVSKNVLVIPENTSLPIQVGIYDSRTKAKIGPFIKSSSSICFVINGSFEIEERLAEHRDALLLWNLEAIDFESLSEAAIILHMNIPTVPHS